MPDNRPPLILAPEALEARLGEPGLLVVDLCKAENYRQYHVPGAVHLEYADIIRVERPTMGLLPDAATLARVLSGLGLTPDTHVVAYDDEGGGKAARLLWTLDVVGHHAYSLLDGGLHAWANEQHPLDSAPVTPTPADFPVTLDERPVADHRWIQARLDDPGVLLLDARSPAEYAGEKVFAARGGHVPGAVNLEWTLAMDPDRNLRLRPRAALEALLAERGVTPDKEIVTYCQTHHRSSHTYIVLKSLGYERLRGYPGSWSDWGNREGLPVER